MLLIREEVSDFVWSAENSKVSAMLKMGILLRLVLGLSNLDCE